MADWIPYTICNLDEMTEAITQYAELASGRLVCTFPLGKDELEALDNGEVIVASLDNNIWIFARTDVRNQAEEILKLRDTPIGKLS